MDGNLNKPAPQKGMNVYGTDNEKLGEVDAVEQDRFMVRKGFFFPEAHYIPMDAVSSVDGENVYLAYTKDQAVAEQWTSAPSATARTAADSGDTDATQAGNMGEGGMERDEEPFTHYQDNQRTHVDEEDDIRVDVHEEELVARRRDVDRGAVHVEKDVVEEEQSIDVPATEEQVEVTRRPVDRDAAADEHAFEEGTFEVSVHGEEVEVDRRARVVEEVDVDKTAETHTEQASDTVRREQVSINGEPVETDADSDSRA